MNTDNFHGIIFYTIELNGCLNGVYTNIRANGIICNEIAIKSDRNTEPSDITGKYQSQWFEGVESNKADLYIDRHEGNESVYSFGWLNEKGDDMYTGIGYKVNERQIVVHYWEGK